MYGLDVRGCVDIGVRMLRRIVLKYLWVWLSENRKQRKSDKSPSLLACWTFSEFRRKIWHLGNSSYVSGTNKQKPLLPSPFHIPSSSCSSQDFCTGVCVMNARDRQECSIPSLVPVVWLGLI